MGTRDPVIVGVGLSDYPRTPHLDHFQHHALAAQRALADSGLPLSAIDGYASAADHPEANSAALADGRCDTVLITYGSDRLSRLGRTLGTGFHGAGDRVGGPPQYEAPYGLPLIGAYAMAAQRHMHEYGTTSAQ